MGNEFVFAGAFFEEAGDLILVFRGQDGAGGVEEFSAGLEHARILCEELSLDRADAVEGGGLEAPFEVGLAFQGAEAGAGGIDEQGIGDVFKVHRCGLGDGLRGNGSGASALRAILKLVELFRIHIHCKDARSVI